MRRLVTSNMLWAAVAAASLATAVAAPSGPANAAVLPDFGAATFLPGAPIDNPLFPFNQPLRRIYVAERVGPGEPIDERFEQTNLGPGLVILGVQTQVQLDRAFEDGLLVENTRDYFAQDTAGNVWYFGEDSTSFTYDDDGNLIGTDTSGSWRAGVDDARPGFIMPVDQTIGFNYFQEFAPANDAVDEATTFATGLTLSTIFGDRSGVLKVLETSQLEPGVFEAKYYAPGIGLILEEEGLNAQGQNPAVRFRLVSIQAVPEPASWALLIIGFAGMGAMTRVRLHRAHMRRAAAGEARRPDSR